MKVMMINMNCQELKDLQRSSLLTVCKRDDGDFQNSKDGRNSVAVVMLLDVIRSL